MKSKDILQIIFFPFHILQFFSLLTWPYEIEGYISFLTMENCLPDSGLVCGYSLQGAHFQGDSFCYLLWSCILVSLEERKLILKNFCLTITGFRLLFFFMLNNLSMHKHDFKKLKLVFFSMNVGFYHCRQM